MIEPSAELLERARSASAHAYAPYSGYRVGAAVRARDGRLFTGVNVENAAYPLGVCAERAAVANAVGEGCKPGDLEEIAITASPCGGCRQWLHEFRIERITFESAAGEITSHAAAELLPEAWEL